MAEPVARDPWRAFAHDPRDPTFAPLRASDADREIVRQQLTEAFSDGRLDREEYDERTDAVLAARTLGELPPLLGDLVPERPLLPASLGTASASDLQRRAEEKWHRERREAIGGFLFPTVICWVIWLSLYVAGNGHFPWPAIVTAATGLNMLRVLASRGEIIAGEVRRLERKQAKELRARDRKPPTS